MNTQEQSGMEGVQRTMSRLAEFGISPPLSMDIYPNAPTLMVECWVDMGRACEVAWSQTVLS